MAENFCGTGLWTGPKPGDPDNNVILSARPVTGGIEVYWTYPGLNPHAVSYTILYRSTSGTEATKVQYSIVAGNMFFDRIEVADQYFYWIQIVSINGTVGELIGPASAISTDNLEDLIRTISGRIDEGVLAQSLRQDIAQIRLNTLGITQEILDRAENDAALGAAFNEVQAYTEATRSLVQQEILARAEADAAFVTSVNTVYATVQENAAAIQTVSDARVAGDEALAKQITTTQSVLGDQISSVQVGLSTSIKSVGDRVTDIGALYTAKVSVNGLIGGFGVYNDGTSVQAGFDVDTFWVGRTSTDGTKPFIVYNNKVYINDAVIPTITANKIDSRGLTIKDASGNTILGSGVNLDWSKVNGLGELSKLNKINGTYIENLTVRTIDILDGAVTTAWSGSISEAVALPSKGTTYTTNFPSFTVPSAGVLIVTVNMLWHNSASETNYRVQGYALINGSSIMNDQPVLWLNGVGSVSGFSPIGPLDKSSGSSAAYTVADRRTVFAGQTITISIKSKPANDNSKVYLLAASYTALLAKK